MHQYIAEFDDSEPVIFKANNDDEAWATLNTYLAGLTIKPTHYALYRMTRI